MKRVRGNKAVTVLLSAGILLCCCRQITQNNDDGLLTLHRKVTVYNSWLSDLDRLDSASFYVDTLTINYQRQIVYCNSIEMMSHFRPSTFYIYPHYWKKDSFYFMDEYCPAEDTIDIEYKDQKIRLVKYYYDIENSIDEESDVYANPRYGLIAVYNAWGIWTLFENDIISGFVHNNFSDYIRKKRKELREEIHRALFGEGFPDEDITNNQ